MQTTLLLWLCQDALFLGQPRKKPKIVQAKLIKRSAMKAQDPIVQIPRRPSIRSGYTLEAWSLVLILLNSSSSLCTTVIF